MQSYPASLETVGVDCIIDFGPGIDKIVLSRAAFRVLTSEARDFLGNPINANEFASIANDADAATSNAFIVYSTSTGNLFYNQNGAETSLDTGGQFSTLLPFLLGL